jgi:predicted nucleotidyltransferase
VTNFSALLAALHDAGVEYILVGGVAATVHGSSRLTVDIDVVYSRTAENLERVVQSLKPFQPYLRGAPPGLPFQWDTETLNRGLNFTLITTLGSIDLLGEITGGGSFEQLLPDTVNVTPFGIPCRCITLDRLIQVKRAAGRIKDLEAIAELEALREERDRPLT